MKINENLSILFWLWRSKASKDGAVPIYVRITVNGDRDGFSSGRKIQPNYWNEQTGTPLKVCPEGRAIDAYINKVIMWRIR